MARDVAAFMAWAADPTLEDRKRVGLKVVLFLVVLSALIVRVEAAALVDAALTARPAGEQR